MPWTSGRISAAISRAIASPSAAARPLASARRIRSTTASGTRTPGTSLAMNSAWRRLSSGAIAASTGIRNASMRRRNRASSLGIEDRLRDRELRARLHLVFEPAQLLVRIERAGIGGDADVKRRRRADGLPADVGAAVEPRDHVRQADRIDVEDAGRVRIVADLRRIAGDEQQVADAHRVRAEQIRLHAEQVPIAAGVVEDRLDAGLLLHQDRRRQRAHPRAGARTVGDVHEVDAVDPQLPRLLDERLGAEPARRHQLDADDERAAREGVGHPRLLRARPPARRSGAVGTVTPRRRPTPHAAARSRSARAPRTAILMWRMCSGVVPQQPPTSRTPLLMKRRAYDAMYSGEHR